MILSEVLRIFSPYCSETCPTNNSVAILKWPDQVVTINNLPSSNSKESYNPTTAVHTLHLKMAPECALEDNIHCIIVVPFNIV